MKHIRFIAAIAALLALSCLGASAQNELYKKYSSTPGITKVYISKAMFSLMGSSSGKGRKMNIDAGGGEVDVSKLSRKLTGLYILSTENPKVGQQLLSDFAALSKGKNIELLMEVEDEGDKIKMYSIKKGDINTDFFLTSKESDGEITVLHLEGSLTDADVAEIMQSAQN